MKNILSVDDLLIPRYQIIAGYPFMRKIIIMALLFVCVGCREVSHECIVVDKYRTFTKYGKPYSYLILKDKATGKIYEERVEASQYITPIGGSITKDEQL